MTYPYGRKSGGMSPDTANWIFSQMEIGETVECDIGSLAQKVDLWDELGLTDASQVEILAEEAGCYIYQGGLEVMEAGWQWPTANYRLLANERTIRNVRSQDTACFAIIATGVATGKAVFTETRKR